MLSLHVNVHDFLISKISVSDRQTEYTNAKSGCYICMANCMALVGYHREIRPSQIRVQITVDWSADITTPLQNMADGG